MNAKSFIHILDDDEAYATLLSMVVEKQGVTVVRNTSAIAFLASTLPDNFILILDLVMPEMDGIEVIRELAKKESQVSLILISGFDDRVLHSAQQLAEAHKIQVLGCFTKPIDINELRNFIDTIPIQERGIATSPLGDSLSLSDVLASIEQELFVLHYQPQIELSTDNLLGYEVLVRMNHPQYGLVYPDRFLQVIEDHKLMGLLTKEVINIACRDMATHAEKFEGLVVSVNISSQNIVSLEFPELLEQITNQYGVSPKQICLELTESAVMSELTSSLDVLNRLRMKGFSLSIDDFGTGHSSLVQLYNAPFSELKIDKNFVMRMESDNEAKAIVDICIMLGHKMSMKVVAEGVESEEIAKMLAAQKCDVAQGYGISRPKKLAEILAWRESKQSLQK